MLDGYVRDAWAMLKMSLCIDLESILKRLSHI